jgi:hypothetical protein
VLVAVVLVVQATACIDFVEPDLAERGAAAVLEATFRVHDRGRIELEARLAPGLDRSGFVRVLERESFRLGRIEVAPSAVQPNGTRVFSFARDTLRGVAASALRFEGPVVRGAPPPPAGVWFGLGRVDADTIPWVPGADLVLRVDAEPGPSDPAPAIRQWFLTLEGRDGSVRLSADGAPPGAIVLPAGWVPAPRDTTVEVRLVYLQSLRTGAEGEAYIGLITLDARMEWTVRVRPSAGAARGVDR